MIFSEKLAFAWLLWRVTETEFYMSSTCMVLLCFTENQIMSENDREDIPNDVIPLPERPPR